jgi:hypothetical protein
MTLVGDTKAIFLRCSFLSLMVNYPAFGRINVWTILVFSIPESMWATAATMNSDDTAAKWLQVYKKKHGITTWDDLVKAVEEKSGVDDYRSALSELLELKQQGSMEDYTAAFESLQYQICIHNFRYDDEVLFVSHFVKGLKDEIQGLVQLYNFSYQVL